MPLVAQSRHPDRVGECLLSVVKRTSKPRELRFNAFHAETFAAALSLLLMLWTAPPTGT